MSSQISISVEGLKDASGSKIKVNPIGVELNYTYNEIPFALVNLQGTDVALLCGFEQYRRQPVTIKISSEFGCIKFEGLVDGLSMAQSVGSIALQMVVKNSFQVLKETYPKLPGLHPAGIDLFRRIDLVKFNGMDGDFFRKISLDVAVKLNIDTNAKNVIDYFIHAAKVFVKGQQQIELVATIAGNVAGIVKVAQDSAKTTLPIALDKLSKIDTTFVKGMPFNASSPMVSNQIIDNLAISNDNLFSSLINSLAEFGCVLVISNSKAFVVPEVGFLKIDHSKVPGPGELSTISNVIYPAQYDTLRFDDNGYRDIRACYVVSDANMQLPGTKFTSELGYYIDPSTAKGGVLTLSLPSYVAIGGAGYLFNATKDQQKSILNEADNISEEFEEASLKESLRATDTKLEAGTADMQDTFINNWAQLKYLQSKYMDRTGSFSMRFNPKWCPAAIGTLYTRRPGVYIDFFVTSVSHRFSVSAPNSGTAETVVNFNCGRMGKSTDGTGIDKVKFYDYDSARSLAFAEAFVVNNALLASQTTGFE